MEFSDTRWSQLQGGYRIPYDPRPALSSLEAGEATEAAWRELWEELHHQGDIGDAAYVAVPHLVRICSARADDNLYQLVGTVELCRRNGRNPEIPDDLRADYDAAWSQLVALGLCQLADADITLSRAILGVLALAKSQPVLAEIALNFDEEELRDRLEGC